ncbi:MAG: hypothetical protein QF570_07760 [Myxococcota bacterium]|jgi:hypothetical protein|nr:hypothetical protein [Myxococcota bacterium]
MVVRSTIPLALLAAAVVLLVSAPAAADEPRVEPVDLKAAERKGFSQFGEDGVVEKIFEIIEPGPKFAVEFGAYDGINNSNMRNLVVNHGWKSYQIEGNKGRARQLAKNYADYPGTKTEQAWVWPGNIEVLFERAGVPKDLDFLVIDIDSNDYYVWRAIHDFRPKVVMIETNLVFPPPELMVIDFHPMNYWDQTYYIGASMQSLVNLGKKKGYELLYQMSWGPNVFFVAKEYFPLFGIEDNSPEAIYRPPPAEVFERPNANWGRNGVPWPKGKETLRWKNLVIEKKFLDDM